MRAKSQNGIAHIIEVGHLRFIAQDTILKLARVPHYDAIADDDVFAHVTATADMALLADPGRTFYDGALFDDGVSANEDGIADERFSHQLSQHRRLQTKLEITCDLFERVPNEALILEKLGVGRVLERDELSGRECFFRA